jgi:hypothetical protein
MSQVFSNKGLAFPEIFPQTVLMETQAGIIRRLELAIAELLAIKESLLKPQAFAVSPEIQSKVAEKISAGLCLYCETPLDDGSTTRPTRGVHNKCYKRIVANSEKSLDEHVMVGLLLPGKSGGRPSTFVDKASEILSVKKIDDTIAPMQKSQEAKRAKKK